MTCRPRRAHLLAVALILTGALAAGCNAGPAKPAPANSPGLTSAELGCLLPPASCYAPRLLRVAYGIQPVLDAGIDGRGETVTVLATPDPSGPAHQTGNGPETTPLSSRHPRARPGGEPASTGISKDLQAFDRLFGLPGARIEVVTARARSGSRPQVSGEDVQDLEMVHAVAPAATLRVVLMPSNALASVANATADMIAGLRLAVSRTNVASVGWSLGEHYFTKSQVTQIGSILRGAAAHHVTVVAGSGNNGSYSGSYRGFATGTNPVREVSLPASSPLVLAVGGTTLTANPVTGAYVRETAWNGDAGIVDTVGASAGGFSHLFARPAYQNGVHGISAMRGVPDVAGDANALGGLPIVSAVGTKAWINSASDSGSAAALWAGLIALADQYAHHSLGFVDPAIYRIARSSKYHKAFHDIKVGTNLIFGPVKDSYRAGPGWDAVTGWGSPDAQVLIPLLARLSGRGQK